MRITKYLILKDVFYINYSVSPRVFFIEFIDVRDIPLKKKTALGLITLMC